MRPYISEINERGGKRHLLPLPPKYRELLDCVKDLGIKTYEDENEMAHTGYVSLISPAPTLEDSYPRVNNAAIWLSDMTAEQVTAIESLCAAFALDFNGLYELVNFIKNLKGDNENADD